MKRSLFRLDRYKEPSPYVRSRYNWTNRTEYETFMNIRLTQLKIIFKTCETNNWKNTTKEERNYLNYSIEYAEKEIEMLKQNAEYGPYILSCHLTKNLRDMV